MLIKNADGEVFDVIERPVNISKIEAEIADYEGIILSSPKIKDKPDQETLDFWNDWARSNEHTNKFVLEKINTLKEKVSEAKATPISTVDVKLTAVDVDVEPIIKDVEVIK